MQLGSRRPLVYNAGGGYLAAVLADSPQVVYALDEPSGATLTDSSTHADAGTIVGTPTYGVSGPILGHNAMYFDTADTDYAHNTNTVNDTLATVEVWAKIASPPASDSQIAGFVQGNSIATSDKDMIVSSLGFFRFYCFDTVASSGKSRTGLTQIADNAWHHLVGVADGTNIQIYVDGLNDQPGAATACGVTFAAYAAGQPSLQLARHQTGLTNVATPIQLAYFAVYSTALSAARIAAHYAARNT